MLVALGTEATITVMSFQKFSEEDRCMVSLLPNVSRYLHDPGLEVGVRAPNERYGKLDVLWPRDPSYRTILTASGV